MKIKAILIDPTRQTVEAIDMDSTLRGFLTAIQCKHIASYGAFDNGDLATGDDEALLKGPTPLFWFNRYPLPLGGRVVITNVDAEGECVNVRSSLEDIRRLVRFVPHAQTEQVYLAHHGCLMR